MSGVRMVRMRVLKVGGSSGVRLRVLVGMVVTVRMVRVEDFPGGKIKDGEGGGSPGEETEDGNSDEGREDEGGEGVGEGEGGEDAGGKGGGSLVGESMG